MQKCAHFAFWCEIASLVIEENIRIEKQRSLRLPRRIEQLLGRHHQIRNNYRNEDRQHQRREDTPETPRIKRPHSKPTMSQPVGQHGPGHQKTTEHEKQIYAQISGAETG